MSAPDGGEPANNILAFQPRSVVGDWTAAELQRLEELAQKLEAQGAHIGAAYGVSDAGDPWCVITNEADEVLIHVARIDGRFVVHDATADALQDGDTLWSACDRLLGQAWRDGREDGVVIPLHQAQVLLALVAALVFEQEGRSDRPAATPALQTAHANTAPVGATLTTAIAAAAVDDLHAAPRAAASPQDEALSHRTASLTPADPLVAALAPPASSEASAPAAPPAHVNPIEPVQVAAASVPNASLAPGVGEVGRVLTGGHTSDVLVGGPGADTLAGGGAGPGQTDVLLGGGGDDRLLMAAQTVAVGGPGHDVFAFGRPTPPDPHPPVTPSPPAQPGAVEGPPTATAPTSGTPAPTTPSLAPPTVAPPAHPTPETPTAGPTTPPPPLQAGVILDFTADDRLDFGPGVQVTIVSVEATPDVLAGLHNNPALTSFGPTPGATIGFDVDGDGVADLTVLMAGPAVASLTVGSTFDGSVAAHPTPDQAAGFLTSIHTAVPGAFLLG